jgi:hypothetical protein
MLERYEQQLSKNLKPIQEEPEEGSSKHLQSYEYALEHDGNSDAVSFASIENSGNDLNNGNHFEINKALYQNKPAGAPEVKKHVMKEFADSALTSDFAQNAKLGL